MGLDVQIAVTRTVDGERLVADRGDGEFLLTPVSDLGAALANGTVADLGALGGRSVDIADLSLAPVVGTSGKVICVGHNFTQHILEMGHGLPEYPNVFSKFREALVGANDAIELDPVSSAWDWEAELVMVIGRPARRVSEETALDYVAGYTVANDISARDWQRRGSQWLLGKTFQSTTPIGPWMVTADEVDPADGLSLSCMVDGIEKQNSTTADLLFGPGFLVSYLSHVLTLNPGDIVLTGTPAGVGAGREPAEYLKPGQTVVTEIEGIGRLVNSCAAPSFAA